MIDSYNSYFLLSDCIPQRSDNQTYAVNRFTGTLSVKNNLSCCVKRFFHYISYDTSADRILKVINKALSNIKTAEDLPDYYSEKWVGRMEDIVSWADSKNEEGLSEVKGELEAKKAEICQFQESCKETVKKVQNLLSNILGGLEDGQTYGMNYLFKTVYREESFSKKGWLSNFLHGLLYTQNSYRIWKEYQDSSTTQIAGVFSNIIGIFSFLETTPIDVTELFERYQNQLNAPLPPVPEEGIKAGCVNIGNACWMNSVLKFIAGCDVFDSMVQEVSREDVRNLQKVLKIIIFLLRTELKDNFTIPEDPCKAFMQEVLTVSQSTGTYKFSQGQQCDASEALFFLLDTLSFKTEHKVQQTKIYQPSENSQFTVLGNQEWLPDFYKATIPAELSSATKLDLASLATEADKINKRPLCKQEEDGTTSVYVDLVLDKGKRADSKPKMALYSIDASEKKVFKGVIDAESVENIECSVNKCFTQLPSTLFLFLSRNIKNDRGQDCKVDAPLAVDENEEITLFEYETVTGEIRGITDHPADLTHEIGECTYKETPISGGITGVREKRKCIYRIGAVIEHSGYSGSGGHYVYKERTNSGIARAHSDESTYEVPLGSDFGTKGYVFRLDLVRTESV
ncbi:MAG: hypothetical protein HKM07_07840 [Chlamydiae bacterium]|nr:hypothetical protein [Chlamydiota bacterium]